MAKEKITVSMPYNGLTQHVSMKKMEGEGTLKVSMPYNGLTQHGIYHCRRWTDVQVVSMPYNGLAQPFYAINKRRGEKSM